MRTKLGEYRGYTIFYDAQGRQFVLCNAEGDDVGQGETQTAVESQADKLSKKKYPFPIAAFKVSGIDLFLGRVTSLNPADCSVRFVYDKETAESWQTSSKERIRYGSPVYEATEANMAIREKIQYLNNYRDELAQQIKNLMGQLEKPLDTKYFGLGME